MKLLPKEGVRYVFTIYLDEDKEEALRDVHLFIFGNKLPSNATLQDIERIEYEGTKRYVLRKLSQRGLASSELKKLLRKYLVAESVIEAVLDECTQKGFIDDELWIESFIRSQLRRKCGPEAIKQKLFHKGIPPDSIENALKNLDSLENQGERILALLESRYKNRDLSNFKERNKVIAALMRKGFSLDSINQILTIHTTH